MRRSVRSSLAQTTIAPFSLSGSSDSLSDASDTADLGDACSEAGAGVRSVHGRLGLLQAAPAGWPLRRHRGRGPGIGGLAAAAALAKAHGKRALVLERHYTAGGFTHAFTRPGYEWTCVGVHYVGQVGPRGALRPAYDWLTDGALDWAALPDVYDCVRTGQRTYDFVSGTSASSRGSRTTSRARTARSSATSTS